MNNRKHPSLRHDRAGATFPSFKPRAQRYQSQYTRSALSEISLLTVGQNSWSVRFWLREVEQASERGRGHRERPVRFVHLPARQQLIEAPQERRRFGKDQAAVSIFWSVERGHSRKWVEVTSQMYWPLRLP